MVWATLFAQLLRQCFSEEDISSLLKLVMQSLKQESMKVVESFMEIFYSNKDCWLAPLDENIFLF